MAVKKIATLFDPPHRDFIYSILRNLELGLCVDIGAAAGEHTLYILDAGGPATRVVAFEPFPGNHGFFREKTAGRAVRLVPAAVSDVAGKVRFVVDSTVQGSEPGWEKLTGYSSVGFIQPLSLKRRLKDVVKKALHRDKPAQVLDVSSTTIDLELPGEHIDYMKIDVQGAEASVLRGARRLLDAGEVGILYIEWSGANEEVDFLEERGYTIYDSVYVAGGTSGSFEPFEAIGFEFIKESHLSVGEVAYYMRLPEASISPKEAMAAVAKAHLGWIQTDLIAVSPSVEPEFMEAVAKFRESLRAAA